MTNKKIIIKRTLLLGLSIILLSGLVSALGIGMTYTQANPLEIGPGETKVIQLTPNSMASEGSMKLAAKIIKGSEIASFVDSNAVYNLPAGGETPVKVRISVPAGVSVGTEYIVGFSFMDVAKPEGSGTVTVKTANEVSMKVIVKIPPPVEKTPVVTPPVEKPAGSYSWAIIVVALAVIIVIVAYLLLRKKKSK